MKILVADDDPILRRLMRELLFGRLGYEVIEAAQGRDAWQALDAGLRPDLCILDILMPELGGLEVLCRMRGDRRFWRQKVMLCSSASDRRTVMEAGALEVEGYLVKPFTAEQFLTLVKKVCVPIQPQGPPPALEAVETLLQRLGIGKDLYLELVSAFTGEIRGLLACFSSGLAAADRNGLELRLVSARGAGLSLGAAPATAAIRRLESALASRDSTALAASLEALEYESARIVAAVGGSEPAAGPAAEPEPSAETTPVESKATEVAV